MVQPDRPKNDNIIQSVRFACWINTGTHTHTHTHTFKIYNIFVFLLFHGKTFFVNVP
jgi:hypothetical protein